jgi:hypothetical protein
MPQILAFGLLGAALWAGYKWVSTEAARVAERVREAEDELLRRTQRTAGGEPEVTAGGSVDVKSLPRLEPDPDTGVYRPRGSV